MLSSIRSRRRFILASVKFLSRALTALNLEPSMATLGTLSKSSLRHSATKLRQTSPMASPLSLRKSAMILKSGANCPVSQTSSILRWHSRSRRRLDKTRLRGHHGIISEPDKGTSPRETWPHLDLEPFVQHVVQE